MLYIGINSGASTTLNNAVVRYGGSGGCCIGNIYIGGGNVSITHSQSVSSSQMGIQINDGIVSIVSSTINNNQVYGIYLQNGTTTILNNDIHGNNFNGAGSYGAYKGSAPTSTAQYNYWGASTGPTNPTNSSGTGDNVSANIDFSNWLTSPP